jgi:hypothetical protein
MTKGGLDRDAPAINVILVSGMLEPNGRTEVNLIAGGAVWSAALAMMTPVLAAIGIAKVAYPPEGWTGSSYLEVLVGWSLLTAPYVIAFGVPMVLACLAATRLLHLSRVGATLLAIPVAFGFFVALAAIV